MELFISILVVIGAVAIVGAIVSYRNRGDTNTNGQSVRTKDEPSERNR